MKDTPFHTETRGRIRVDWYYDSDTEAPWDHEDGHGAVRTVRNREEKRPGERPLHSEGRDTWLYDWQEACKLARRDGWNAEPFDAPNRITRAVQADYDYLRRYLRGDWHWCGYVVTVDDEQQDSLWGIDSDSVKEFTEDAFRDAAKSLEREEAAELDYACRC